MKRLEIVVDTREQRPFIFPEEVASTVSLKLDAGDYALMYKGKIDEGFAVERKSLDDFVGTILCGWERFLKELDRMRHMPAIIVLVEGSLEDIFNHEYNSGASPLFVYKRVSQLLMKGVTVEFFVDADTCATFLVMIFNERMHQLRELDK